jgi:Trehalose and maltose hydrolases (possible phosphorylases)
MINRKELICRHNPILHQVDVHSPLTVGNGDFGFTADVTGLQTLYSDYENTLPLCTMSSWGWHTIPVSEEKEQYTLSDLVMTEYEYLDRKVYYPVRKQLGNEMVYHWLRENAHRMSLVNAALCYQGSQIRAEQLSEIEQELNLYEGIIYSNYKISDQPLKAQTASHFERDSFAYSLTGSEEILQDISVKFSFPYGSPNISGADWQANKANKTEVIEMTADFILLKRSVDRDVYWVKIGVQGNLGGKVDFVLSENTVEMSCNAMAKSLFFTVSFYQSEADIKETITANQVFESSKDGWQQFWEKGGIVKLHESEDPRAEELERRIILSQYLLLVNSSGSMPPQETGMTCNSWYGKFHLEMHFWHSAWLGLWGHGKRLEKSVGWYQKRLEEAKENAARNQYKGARWPKMVSEEGIDCPSPIAPLLIWQQPHIIYMLELIYQENTQAEILNSYWELIEQTAEFMADFAVYDEIDECYHLLPPLIPAQERYNAEKVKDPTFEVEYWRVGLEIASQWATRVGDNEKANQWHEISQKMAMPYIFNQLYQGHANCDTTYEEVNEDHPSMTGAMGLLPGERLDRQIMKNSFMKILDCWDYESLWGWDFAMLGMTAVRLGEPELALDIILKETEKNTYVVSGNNNQKTRSDLPLYLPGNGSLLLAMALFCAGSVNSNQECPGFTVDGRWKVEYEGIRPFIK